MRWTWPPWKQDREAAEFQERQEETARRLSSQLTDIFETRDTVHREVLRAVGKRSWPELTRDVWGGKHE